MESEELFFIKKELDYYLLLQNVHVRTINGSACQYALYRVAQKECNDFDR